MNEIFFDNSFEAKFEEDGVVCLPLLNTQELDYFTSIYARDHDTVKDVFHSTMFIKDSQYRKRIDELIRAVLSDKIKLLIKDYRLLFCNFVVKQSSPESSVGIHQDWNFTSPDHTSLNIWIPLVDIDHTTGVFYALNGSHKTFHNIRYTPYPDKAYQHIEQYIFKHSTAYYPKAGEAIIYNGSIVHYSEPNISGRTRVAIGMALIPNGAPNLHYYKRSPDHNTLEVYETDKEFYNGFDFYKEPVGVNKVVELFDYKGLPSIEDLL